MRVKIFALATVASLAFAACDAALASPIVDVGYADTIRPAGFFPNPWVGAANVVSLDPNTCAPSGDCGAIGIDNTAGVTSVTVELGTWSIDTFGGNFSDVTLMVPAGDFGIFVLGDTSDVSGIPGAGASTPAVGCTGTSGTNPNPADTCPMFTLSINGGAFQTFDDSGHVLDTNGWDPGGQDITEAFQWRPVGTSGTNAGTVPEPATLFVLGAGLLGAAGMRRRKSAKA